MKIALNVKYYVAKGGAQTYLRYLAEGLLARGHQVDVFAMEGPGDLPCSAFHAVTPGLCPKAFRDYRFAARSARRLREADYDVILGEQKLFYLDVVRPGGGVWRQYFKRELRSLEGRFFSVLTRRLSLKEHMSRVLEEKLYACPRLKAVIVNSQGTAEALCQAYGLPPDRVHVIYNGVNQERYHPDRRMAQREEARRQFGLSPEDYVVLFLATNFRLKGLRPLLRAMGRLGCEGRLGRMRLLAVGQKRAGRYERLAERLGVRGRVTFHGPSAPDAFYAAADVLAHPTFHDPCANVCLEAMASGLPMVTTRANGASELIRDGENGFVICDALDDQTLADRLAELSDPGLRECMGQAACEAIRPLTPQRNVEQVLGVLESAARGAQRKDQRSG